MAGPAITDPFFRKLYARLVEDLDNRVHVLAAGGALQTGEDGRVDALATALEYKGKVVYIQCLQAVIALGLELDREQYGNKADLGDD